MALFIVLGLVVLLTIVIVAALFILLNKEGQKEEAVPVADLQALKKELSSQVFEQKDLMEKDSELIPVFTPKLTIPIEDPQSSLENEQYKKRAEALEEELRTINLQANGQSQEAQRLITTLTEENQALKSQQANLQQAQQKLDQLESEASGLRTDNANLQVNLEVTNTKVRLLEEEMAAVKVQMGEEIRVANETVTKLTQEKEALLAAPKPEPDEGLQHELETLKIEQIQLTQKYAALEKANEDLRQDLIRARAQSSGLERISFNYKNQLESLQRELQDLKANAHQKDVV
jgi:predicted  nucleic acid-binding Zn-ribbon protein